MKSLEATFNQLLTVSLTEKNDVGIESSCFTRQLADHVQTLIPDRGLSIPNTGLDTLKPNHSVDDLREEVIRCRTTVTVKCPQRCLSTASRSI